MKILFSGHHNPHFFTITEYIESAIRHLGHELFVFEDRNHIIPGRIRKKISFLNKIDLEFINKWILALSASIRPDIAIVTGGHRISSETVQKLINKKVLTILWTIDAPLNFKKIIEVAKYYNYIFCQGTEAVEFLYRAGFRGAIWLPMACDPEMHCSPNSLPEKASPRGRDLVFVGSYYSNRAVILERLTDFKLAIYGPGWEALPLNSKLRLLVRGAHVRPEQWRTIYNTSKIVLSIHYQDPLNRFPVYQASPRVFEAMACGAFVLTDRQKDVLSLFEDGLHLATFSDGDDLVNKINYYLIQDDVRKKIAAAGRQEVLAKHTYVHRVRTLLEHVMPTLATKT